MQCLVQRKVQKKYTKGKIETDRRQKHFFHTFLYLLDEWTNQRYVPKHSVVSKTPDSKIGVVGSTSLPEREVGSQKTWVFISLHRLQIRYSKILLILARLLPIGYFTFYYFFFLIFNLMDAWSLMRGDAFIHFVSGSRRVNIRLGVLLLIPKSPQEQERMNKDRTHSRRFASLACKRLHYPSYRRKLSVKLRGKISISKEQVLYIDPRPGQAIKIGNAHV